MKEVGIFRAELSMTKRSPLGAIEVIGLCGAGKTTVSTKLFSILGQSSTISKVRPEFPVAPSGFRTITTAARLAALYGLVDPSECCRMLRRKSGRWLLLKLGYRIAGLNIRKDLQCRILVDSGVLQPLVTFDVERNIRGFDWNVERLAGILPAPSFILYVRVSPEIAMERYLARERDAGRMVDMERIEERFVRGAETAERLYDLFAGDETRCAILDNNCPGVSESELINLIPELSAATRFC